MSRSLAQNRRLGLKDLVSFVFWVDFLSFLGLLLIFCMVLIVMKLSITTTWAEEKRQIIGERLEQKSQPSAEDRLQAVRESLIQLALEGPTQVNSTSFIDESGTLRDSASFSHDMVVRGVRVLAYGQFAGETQALISADHQAQVPSNTCNASKGGERTSGLNVQHLAVLDVSIDSRVKNADLYQARMVSRALQESLIKQSDRSSIYRLSLRTLPVSAQTVYGLSQNGFGSNPSAASSLQSNQTFSSGTNYYQQALLGRGDQRVTWSMSVRFEPAKDEISGVSGMKVSTKLQNKLDRNFSFEDQQYVWFETKKPNLVTSVLSNVMNEQVQALANLIQRAVEVQLLCIPPQFEVTKWNGREMSVSAGLINGLRVGDQMLVGDPEVIPSRILDKGSLNKLILAEVKSVNSYSAQLKQIAGPSVNSPERWVAVAHRPFN